MFGVVVVWGCEGPVVCVLFFVLGFDEDGSS